MPDSAVAPDFKTTPFWQDAVPPRELPDTALPKDADVVIAGSGYTGLSAALTLARAGRRVHVLEADRYPGAGASTRNAGFVGSQLWSKFKPLAEKIGVEKASAYTLEAIDAHKYVIALIEREQIACHFLYNGRFIAAHSPESYASLTKESEMLKKHFGIECTMVPRERQRQEIGTDFFFGGMVHPLTGSLHPGMYYAGLLDRVLAAGVTIHTNTKALSFDRTSNGGFTVGTSRGTLNAGRVILATNGYTDHTFPWFKRRIITIHTNIAVTEPLDPALIREVLPSGRTFIDTRMNPVSIRPMPDGRRLQFTAARGLFESDNAVKAKEIRDAAGFAVPTVKNVRISHCWTGQMGFTFDKLPHIGERDGVLYAMGYCGTGLPMSTWLGHKLALRVLGDESAATGLDGRTFPTRPFYTGNPWFLPLIIQWYAHKDRRDLKRTRKLTS